jgi:hypothetical protein
MGQATVDLPDPQRAPPPSGGADDLLAQMAGAEIDRLLAEADSGEASAPLSSAPVAYDEPPSQDKPVSSQSSTAAIPLDEKTTTAAKIDGSASAAEQSSAAVADASDDPLAGELDALLATLTANDPPPAPAAPVPTPVAEVVAAEEAAAVPAAATSLAISAESAEILAATEAQVAATGELPSDGAEATSVAERSALASDPGIAESLTAEVPERQPYQQFQFLLKPLEWINAPLNSCPDLLRELIGKAAILTAVNAAALMFYVHFIRRH